VSVDEILKCDHSNESYWAALSCGTVYYAIQGGSNFWVCGWNPKVWPFKWKLLSSAFLWYCLLCCTRWSEVLSKGIHCTERYCGAMFWGRGCIFKNFCYFDFGSSLEWKKWLQWNLNLTNLYTTKPSYNENDIFQPNNSEMHGKEPWYIYNKPITLVSWKFVKSRFHFINKTLPLYLSCLVMVLTL